MKRTRTSTSSTSRVGIRQPTKGVLALAHSGYGCIRARQLFDGRPNVTVVHTGGGARGARRALGALRADRSATVYLIDVGVSTAVAAMAGRLLRRWVVVDTGDAAYALARSVGGRSRAALLLVRFGEEIALRCAGHVVIRGRRHAALLPRDATHVPDVAPPGAGPRSGARVRQRLGLEGAFVVGLVGSIRRAPRLGVTYGWDLVEALPRMPSVAQALIVGDGDGLDELRARARRLGIEGRCRFVGAVPSTEVDEYVAAMDVAISTQSNDVVGAVRTTGKLPLYLACHRPVLASHVGEAVDLLAPLGWTLPYDGVVDPRYPQRLADAVGRWSAEPEVMAQRRRQAAELSRSAFDVDEMRARLRDVLATP
jgi:glycosyltransferase involved in cell wall biosynthesis